MSDKDVIEGMKAFAEWHKSVREQSVEASTWKIPVECIPKKKEVSLSIEEAKLILEALLRLPVEGNKAILKKTLIPLKEKIEQAEGKCESE